MSANTPAVISSPAGTMCSPPTSNPALPPRGLSSTVYAGIRNVATERRRSAECVLRVSRHHKAEKPKALATPSASVLYEYSYDVNHGWYGK